MVSSIISTSRGIENNASTRAGWLEIFSKKNTWKRCWTILDAHNILCYPDDTKRGDPLIKVSIGNIKISSEEGTVISEDNGDQLWCFTIDEKGKQTSFATRTPEEREGWVEIIQDFINQSTKLVSRKKYLLKTFFSYFFE